MPSRSFHSLQAGFDKIQNERLKRNLLQAIPFWFASVITGIVAVGYAKLFSLTEGLALNIHREYAWTIFIISPVCFIVAWWLVRRFSPFARGSGIPQVIAAIELSTPKDHHKVKSLLSVRIILVKISSTLVMVMGGAAIGREGPTIQIAASIFRKVNDMLPEWWPKVSRRNMITTGAAAGLAAAFNTPLGGIIFALEELSKIHFTKFRTALFTAVIIAGLTAQAILGPYLYLGFPKVDDYSLSAFWGVLLVAIIAGLLGASSAKLILQIFAWKSRIRTNGQNILYLFVCSMVVASLTYFVTEKSMGSGKELMNEKLFSADKYTEWEVAGSRVVAPIASFTTGAAGGIFAPSLSTGAGIGSMVSGWFQLNGPNTNLLILAGMVAFLTGITRSPFTSAILVLEMTDRHSLIFHLMAAGIIANVLAYWIDRKPFYEHLKDRFLKEMGHEGVVREGEED